MKNANAHPNITIVDDSFTREDIERMYSKDHAAVWELIRGMAAASKIRPPIFNVVSLQLPVEDGILQCRGLEEIERGWLEHVPDEADTLNRELPENPETLKHFANHDITIEQVDVIETRSKPSSTLNPADLIRLMKSMRIGRPSTYAGHVENLFEAVDKGLLHIDGNNSFYLAEEGRLLLDALDAEDLPTLDAEYSSQLESDLEEIEQGLRSPVQVLKRHLNRLPGVEITAAANPLSQIQDASSERVFLANNATHPPGPIPLPDEINPEIKLSAEHPLRHIRSAFDQVFAEVYNTAEPNHQEAARRKAARAAALGRLFGVFDANEIIDRLNFDLAWRWVVGLCASDMVWAPKYFEKLVQEIDPVVQAMCAAANSFVSRETAN